VINMVIEGNDIIMPMHCPPGRMLYDEEGIRRLFGWCCSWLTRNPEGGNLVFRDRRGEMVFTTEGAFVRQSASGWEALSYLVAEGVDWYWERIEQ